MKELKLLDEFAVETTDCWPAFCNGFLNNLAAEVVEFAHFLLLIRTLWVLPGTEGHVEAWPKLVPNEVVSL